MSPLRPHDLRCKLFCTLRGAAVCSGYQSSRQAWTGAVSGLVAQLSPCSATASRSCLAVCQVFQTSFPSLFSSMRNALPLVNTRPTPSCATSTSRSNYVPLAARGDPTSWARECRPGSRQNITKEHCQYPGLPSTLVRQGALPAFPASMRGSGALEAPSRSQSGCSPT